MSLAGALGATGFVLVFVAVVFVLATAITSSTRNTSERVVRILVVGQVVSAALAFCSGIAAIWVQVTL